MKNMAPIIAAWALSLPACDPGPDHEVRDSGQVCLTSADADAPLSVQVTLDDCISACVENEVEICSISREGNTLHLTSEFSYDDEDEEEACILLCNGQQAHCSSEPLPAGQYVLEHGEDSYPIVIPTGAVPLCL